MNPIGFTVGVCVGAVFGVLGGIALAIFVRDSIENAAYRRAIDEARKDPEVRKMARDVRTRLETRSRFRLIRGGRDRGPFGGAAAS